MQSYLLFAFSLSVFSRRYFYGMNELFSYLNQTEGVYHVRLEAAICVFRFKVKIHLPVT